jgi:hypothetical protein
VDPASWEQRAAAFEAVLKRAGGVAVTQAPST